jgi:hypothetical protein
MYIADPYMPETAQLIDIQKSSGMNRARSEAKRTLALSEYLKRQGITAEEYRDLEVLAKRPWYRQDMAHYTGPIVVPAHQLYGCLIQAADSLNKSQRPCTPDNLRHLLRLTDFPTDRQKEDGIYNRLVMPKNGAGQPLSNQRSLRSDPFISDFKAKGTVSFIREQILNADELPDFLAYAGVTIGVGAARKMACGRFEVETWDVGIPKTK